MSLKWKDSDLDGNGTIQDVEVLQENNKVALQIPIALIQNYRIHYV